MSKKVERAALTQAEVKKLFDYDEVTGWLTWRARPNMKTNQAGRVGKRAGTLNKQSYRYVGLNDVIYRDTFIIWLWMTGNKPSNVMTKNKNKQDTSWSNLTTGQRGQERPLRSTRGSYFKHGVAGIRQYGNGRYSAQINYDGTSTRLGTFATLEEAIAARLNAEAALPTDGAWKPGRPRRVTFGGMTKNLSQWGRHFGIRRETFAKRLAQGVSFEDMGNPPSFAKPGRPRRDDRA